jgi:dipeptidase D
MGVTAMSSALSGVEPAAFWEHFDALTRIARPSRNEEPVIEHVRAWAAARGFELEQDAGRNLVIRVPASPGREAAPTVILQGHLDMVCERQPDSPNDPAEGRIELQRDGDWLTADGTTLGADDGVAIAAMMSLVEDDSLPHGPLELLMTVAEEVGLEGANALDGSLLSGTILLNLDSEEDGKLTVGCAGSTDTWLRVSSPREALDPDAVTFALTVSGGLGGHSGVQIAIGHSNAVKVLARVLREAYDAAPFRLVSLDGGKSRNAIPRDARAVCSVPADSEAAFRSAVATSVATIKDEFAKTDPGVDLSVEAAEPAADGWTKEGTAKLLDAVALVPTGPLAMSPDFDDLVETSTSLGEALTEGDRLTLHSLSRSSNDSAMPGLVGGLDAAARLAGGELEVKFNYGGWRPNLDSPVLASTKRVYERLFGEEPIVTAVHAGLESSVISDKVQHKLDMLSIGPQIEAPHSPDERVSIPTVQRFWQLLVGAVDELAKPGART